MIRKQNQLSLHYDTQSPAILMLDADLAEILHYCLYQRILPKPVGPQQKSGLINAFEQDYQLAHVKDLEGDVHELISKDLHSSLHLLAERYSLKDEIKRFANKLSPTHLKSELHHLLKV